MVANFHGTLTMDFASLNCKTVPDMICFGLPRLVIDLLTYNRNCSEDVSLMSSKWTACQESGK